MFWMDDRVLFEKKKERYVLIESASYSLKGSQYVCWGAQVFFQPGAYCLTDYCPNSTLAITPRRRSLL